VKRNTNNLWKKRGENKRRGKKHNKDHKGKHSGSKKKQEDRNERSRSDRHQGKNQRKTAEDKKKANQAAAAKKKAQQHTKMNMKQIREAKTMGSLAGIATLRRSGDVMIQDADTHKIVTSTFTVGPLALEVSKTYGRGQARTVRTAKAVTEVMFGTMQIKVKPDGSAHVKKVVFKNPESVEVKGSITDKRQRSDTYLKNSVKRMRPIAAQKILKTARYVLKAPSSVRRN